MRRVVRAFLVWALAIALPVQGMAASAMLFCGASHQRMMQGLQIGAPAADHAGHAHVAAGGAAAPHALHGADADADADGGRGFLPPHGKSSCSACAACCLALALPAEFRLPEAPGPVHPMQSAPVTPVASHPPDGLDRPPRTIPG